MTKANECTCPSGDGSLRHPCPAHPASVKQTGGDEREAAIAKFAETCPMTAESAAGGKSYDIELRRYYLLGWDDRAALAQPSPKCSTCNDRGHVCIDWEAGAWEKCPDCAQAEAELDFSRPLETENGEPVKWICADVIEYKSARVCVAKDTGLVYSSPYIGLKIRNVMPEQAEAERPEVVGYLLTKGNGTLSILRAGSSDEPVMTVAQHDRIVDALRFERQQMDRAFTACINERDAALARVEQQERTIAGMNEAHAKLAGLYEAAQAQHSVPDGFREKFKQCMELAFAEIAYYVSPEKARDPNSRARKAGALATELLDMLAAAPGTEVPQAWLDVQAERRRQITAEGWTPEHDDEHACDEIAAFACFYAMPPAARDWDASSTGYGDTLGEAILPEGWEPKTGDRRRELVKAGGLILAEIERLDRAAAPGKEGV
ncbi:hypothetical protein R4K02_20775 [Pseudomonas aeruginosa]|uniref:hypothetical protein n=1 Tax=Pseudomonas aeruginosa TaxID=287 RepID=UPI0029548CE4|nr:hypothetical protein [Pseudomonas aeruginosa]MDV7979510.1 hypothetical protein [Pseudomonas aeruginosa]